MKTPFSAARSFQWSKSPHAWLDCYARLPSPFGRPYLRDQEADVFRRATAALRQAQSGSNVVQTRALADNSLLWTTLVITLKDPDNALPAPLRGSIISIGLAVQRELNAKKPDFPFLIGINEQMTAGLMSI